MHDRLTNRPSQLPARPDWNTNINNWENHWHNHYHYYGGWHHGHWHGSYWQPGAAWDYWWDNYPALSAFGLTTWAVNRVGWAFGYYNYSNPYYVASPTVVDNSVYNYSQPIVMMPAEETLSADPVQSTSAAPEPSAPALSAFDTARQQFYQGQYEEALQSINEALQEMPNDTVMHEFRALTLFALGRYQDAAATLYAVLGVGPGWDWTTMGGLYGSVDDYTAQLRALESHVKSNPSDSAARFVLAYHYITAGHDDAAVSQLEVLVQQQPSDSLSKQLLLQLDPDAEIPDPPEPTKPPAPSGNVESSALLGSWKAERSGGSFEMTLNEAGDFAWTFTQGDSSQKVTGAWAVEEDGTLALEMNDGGVMLAQIDLESPDSLKFYMIGDTQGGEPLSFKKS